MNTPFETPRGQASETETNAHGNTATRTHGLDGATETSTTFGAATAPVSSAGGRADDPAWGLTAAFGVWVASVGLLLAGGLVALVAYALIRIPSFNMVDLQRAVESDPLVILLSIAAMIPVHLLTFAVAWAVVTGFNRRPFRETVGWSWGERFGLLTCIGMAIGLWLLGIALATLFGGQETDIDRIIASSNAARFSVAFLAVVTAPIVEETVYRGVLFPPLRRAAGNTWAIIIVTLMFASVHFFQYWNNLGVIAAVTLLSLVLTWVRAHTGRLLPCFVIHAAFNGIQAIIIIAQPYLKTLVPTGPNAPPQQSALICDAIVGALARVCL
ncbi:MAG TPA: CPBP family intramembrane glutamic endopeptidase [Pyrinomonadaceae bacterium]|nr:CPBP family intramembrane glutamic endopeptidase [Pyrinomonadaceae bacterium]